jgi:hypothetical protein
MLIACDEVSTVRKAPFILDEIAQNAGKTFAIVIDEAHSSQSGKTSWSSTPKRQLLESLGMVLQST